MSYGIQLNTTAGTLDQIDANTVYLDILNVVRLTSMAASGSRVLTGYSPSTHDLLLVARSGFIPIWWTSGSTFYWESYNGRANAVDIFVLRKTHA